MSLYKRAKKNVPLTYSVLEFNKALVSLREEQGDCTEVFIKHGIKMELAVFVKAITSKLETRAIAMVQKNPLISQESWANELYVNFLSALPDGRFSEMFKDFPRLQFDEVLGHIIQSNPEPCQRSRTFDDFVIGIVPGAVRHVPEPEPEHEPKSKPKSRMKRKSDESKPGVQKKKGSLWIAPDIETGAGSETKPETKAEQQTKIPSRKLPRTRKRRKDIDS